MALSHRCGTSRPPRGLFSEGGPWSLLWLHDITPVAPMPIPAAIVSSPLAFDYLAVALRHERAIIDYKEASWKTWISN
jgi:hypothetical protein